MNFMNVRVLQKYDNHAILRAYNVLLTFKKDIIEVI